MNNNIQSNTYTSCHNRAVDANEVAHQAIMVRTTVEQEQSLIVAMDNAVTPMILLLAMFGYAVAFYGEYKLSYPFYHNYMEDNPLGLVAIILIVGCLISEQVKYYLPAFRTLYVNKAIKDNENILREEIEATAKKHFFWSKLVGSLIFLVVCFYLGKISYDRVMLSVAGGESEGFSLIDILVVVAFTVEVVCGIFLIHAFERFWKGLKLIYFTHTFKVLRKKCASLTALTHAYYLRVIEESGAKAVLSEEILVAVNRYQSKSIGDDNYLENDIAQPIREVTNQEQSTSQSTTSTVRNTNNFSLNTSTEANNTTPVVVRRPIGFIQYDD